MYKRLITFVVAALVAFSLLFGIAYVIRHKKYNFVLSTDYLVNLKDNWTIVSDDTAEYIIPGNAPDEMQLCFVSNYHTCIVRIDGKSLLHTYASIEDETPIYTYWVDIPDGSAGKTLSVQVVSEGGLEDVVSSRSMFGTHHSLLFSFLANSIYVILFIIVSLVLILIFVFGGLWLKTVNISIEDIDLWAFSFFVFLSGVYLFTESQLMSLFKGYYTAIALLNLVSIAMLPVALSAFQIRFYPKLRITLNIFNLITVVLFIYNIFMLALNKMAIYTMLPVYNSLTIVASVILIIATATNPFNTNDYKILGIANLLFSVSSAIVLAYYYIDTTGNYNLLYTVSFSIYIVLLMMGAIVRIYGGIKKSESDEREILENAVQEAEDANRAKTVFLLSISHDIRTPMNAILGYSRMAKKHADEPDTVRSCVDKVENSGKHLISLISEVLEMSRIENSRVVMKSEPLDIRKLFLDSMDMISENAVEKNISVQTSLEGLKHPIVVGDAVRLESILLNIAGNSVKYTGEGGKIRCTLSEVQISESLSQYRIVVKDNGIGMSQKTVDGIFDAFSRGEGNSVEGIQGTGLGMSITKAYVDMMHGDILIDSTLGEGTATTVYVNLPIADGIESGSADEDSAPEENLSGLHVLLVEDNALNRDIAGDLLGDLDITADEAEDGNTALEMLEKAEPGRYSLVLMDIMMPGINGYETTKRIRIMDSPVASIPVIAMTANVFEESLQQEKEAGMNGHVSKPVDPDELKKVISEVLRRA